MGNTAELTATARDFRFSLFRWNLYGYFPDDAEALRCASQRRFTASAMRLRPSGLSFLLTLFAGLGAVDFAAVAVLLRLRAVFWGAAAELPLSSARACWSNAISRSTEATISDIAIKSPMVPASDRLLQSEGWYWLPTVLQPENDSTPGAKSRTDSGCSPRALSYRPARSSLSYSRYNNL